MKKDSAELSPHRERSSGPSHAGWSESRDDATNDAFFEAERETRYVTGELLGRGGMGEIRRAYDQTLRRDVALKRTVGADDSCVQTGRLVHEAWITAQLDHPSIVPIYDGGTDAAGRAYYTMRLIQGRTLTVAMDDASLSQNALLRHFLAAVEAVAFAHSRGIVHRDLKPDNIMVGPFGETLVVDWGLASVTSNVEDAPSATDVPHASGDVAGTRAYMSPEQARGEIVDPRADVWSLGVILRELINRRNTMAGAPHAGSEPRVSNELFAIIAKAGALTPRDRYAHAGEFAADLSNYLDGRKVAAYEYTTLELVTRVLQRLRLPLVVLLGVALVSVSAIAAAFHRTQVAATQARRAELTSAAALAANQRASSWALSEQAMTALEAGATPEAQQLAALALLQHESPQARGVLAATALSPAVRRVASATITDCQRVLPHTLHIAFCQRAGQLDAVRLEDQRLLWRFAGDALQVLSLTNDVVVVVSDVNQLTLLAVADGAVLQQHRVRVTTGVAKLLAATPRGDYVLVSEGRIASLLDVNRGRLMDLGRLTTTCAIAGLAADASSFWALCTDGAMLRLDVVTQKVVTWLTDARLAAIAPVKIHVLGDEMLVGGHHGHVARVQLAARTVGEAQPLAQGSITQLVWQTEGRLAWVADAGRGLGLWDLERGEEWFRLPLRASFGLHKLDDVVITGGAGFTAWQLPSEQTARRWRIGSPLAALALDPVKQRALLGNNDGTIEIRRTQDGALLERATRGAGVVKHIDVSRDGTRWAYSVSEMPGVPHLVIADQVDGGPSELAMPPRLRRAARRVVFDSMKNLIGVHWKPPLSVWSPGHAYQEFTSPEFVDASANGRRDTVWLLAISGSLWRWQAQGPGMGTLVQMDDERGDTMIAALPRMDAVVRCGHMRCLLRRSDGTVTTYVSDQVSLVDVAVSPDEQYVVAGRVDGTLWVWRAATGELVATMVGHRERISQVEFGEDRILYSIGWDGQLQKWDLRVVDQSPVDLQRESERAWGRIVSPL